MFELVPEWASHYEEFWLTIRKRNLWFIKLRYGAVLMLLISIFIPQYILGVVLTDDQQKALLLITVSILLYNSYFYFIRYFLKHDSKSFNPFHLSIIQMIFDLFALMLVVYYTGSVESPLVLLFVIHMIVGSLMLPGFVIYVFAVVIVTAFWGITVGEYYSILLHHHVNGFLPFHLYQNFNYVLALNLSFAFMIFMVVLIANKMAKQLYIREQQLLESIDKINAAETEKQKYIMGIVHEIKTPLAAVQSYLDLILQKFLGPLDEVVEEKLKRAKRRSDEAIELINSILKISKMKLLDSIAYESMMIDLVIKTTIDHQMVNAKAKNVLIRFLDERKEKIPIYGDSFLMQIAISNLINNAIKYVDFEGIIEVTVANKDGDLIINVCDDGIGIPENEADKIFKEFYRASNIKLSEYEGAGIGLPIVKQIVERHGGTIKVKSPSHLGTVDKPGTCFSINLPVKKK